MNVSVPPRLTYPEDEIRLPWLSLLLDAYAVVDKGITIAVSREKRKLRKRPACSEGCDTCCRYNTDIPTYPLELAGLTWYAMEKILEPDRSSLREQLLVQGKNLPCPFRISSTCAVYPVRPIACRQFIVFGKPCSAGEDPYYTRRGDVLTPIQDFTDQAVFIMLPFYGITLDYHRSRAIKDSFIHSKVQNIFSCNWATLAKKMSSFDPLVRKDLRERLNA
jgi:Fe-S-cluster containining protein